MILPKHGWIISQTTLKVYFIFEIAVRNKVSDLRIHLNYYPISVDTSTNKDAGVRVERYTIMLTNHGTIVFYFYWFNGSHTNEIIVITAVYNRI